MEIKRENGKFIIEIPDTVKRFNPYDEEEDCGSMDTLVGLISDFKGIKEYGFAYRIDMTYKDKADQVGEYVIMWPGDEEGFTKACKLLKIDIEDYSAHEYGTPGHTYSQS